MPLCPAIRSFWPPPCTQRRSRRPKIGARSVGLSVGIDRLGHHKRLGVPHLMLERAPMSRPRHWGSQRTLAVFTNVGTELYDQSFASALDSTSFFRAG